MVPQHSKRLNWNCHRLRLWTQQNAHTKPGLWREDLTSGIAKLKETENLKFYLRRVRKLAKRDY